MTTDDALAYFDSLPPVRTDELLGSWRGEEFPSGHPFDGLLARAGWYGKRFESAERVHPLVMGNPGALFAVRAGLIPIRLARRHAALAKALAPVARPLLRLLATRRPQATLREVEYRGVRSAAMVYDALPVHDVFRRADADTLLGAMVLDRDPLPFFFILRREP